MKWYELSSAPSEGPWYSMRLKAQRLPQATDRRPTTRTVSGQRQYHSSGAFLVRKMLANAHNEKKKDLEASIEAVREPDWLSHTKARIDRSR